LAGLLDTRVVLASVVIIVPKRFKNLKASPPTVFCTEPWMRTGPDWHNGPPLCWVLPDEWHDVMNWKGKPAAAILSEGRQWLLNAVSNLVNRHYVAHRENLAEWPAEWTFWNHYDAGVQDYKREKRRAKWARRSQQARNA
jgi:hypothetical protein